MRTITVCPGIGDNIWLFQKLINQPEKFHFRLPGHHPRRGKQIFDLLPQVSASCTYVNGGGVKYGDIKRNNAGTGNWSAIKKPMFYLEANTHLEAGRRIEEFLPDLHTSFRIEYSTTIEDKARAELLKDENNIYVYTAHSKVIGLYGSSYSTARSWGFWGAPEWMRLATAIHRRDPRVGFVLIGADFDSDMNTELADLLRAAGIPFANTIGWNLGAVIEVLKKLDYFFGFPSGLSILNETLGKPGWMFYPPHLREMIGTWSEPGRSGREFKEALFCSPEECFEWWSSEIRI